MSKFATFGIWHGFMMLAILVAIIILEGTQAPDAITGEIIPFITWCRAITFYAESLFVLFLVLCGFSFFVSVDMTPLVSNRHSHRVIKIASALLFVVCYTGLLIPYIFIRNRHATTEGDLDFHMPNFAEFAADMIEPFQRVSADITHIGLEYGRIPIGNNFIDLYVAAFSIGLGLVLLTAAHYLLKKHFSL